jgi:hypothetical protein
MMSVNSKSRQSAKTAMILTAISIASALVVLILLLLLKGGDGSFFAGVTIAVTGAISACASLFIALYTIRTFHAPEKTVTKQFVACIIIDGLYIIMTIIAFAFAWILFSALGH